MGADRNTCATLLALFLAACPDEEHVDLPDCLVGAFDSDVRRLPDFAHEPSASDPRAGVSKAQAMVAVTLDAPRGVYDFGLWLDFAFGHYCNTTNADPELCKYESSSFEADLTSFVPEPGAARALGEFTLECASDNDCPANLIVYGPPAFVLECERERCQGELRFPVALEATARIDRQVAFSVFASLQGDVCEERLPVVTVVVAGWDEPAVRERDAEF